MVAIDLSKQQELDAEPKTKQINITGNLEQDRNTTTMVLILEEVKKLF